MMRFKITNLYKSINNLLEFYIVNYYVNITHLKIQAVLKTFLLFLVILLLICFINCYAFS
jgi:hypothetical protein